MVLSVSTSKLASTAASAPGLIGVDACRDWTLLGKRFQGYSGEYRWGHLLPGLVQAGVAGRGLNHSAVYKAKPLRDLWIGDGKLQRHVGAPGMSGNQWPLHAQAFDQPRKVLAHAGEVIAPLWLSAGSMPALIHRHPLDGRPGPIMALPSPRCGK